MSDLKVEINHNGEIFTPNNWIHENYIGAKYNGDLKTLFSFKTYQHLPFALFQKLLERHFDIYNLIDKRIDIDNNTISVKNDY